MTQQEGGAQGAEVGQMAPDFTLPMTRTESVTLSQYRGQKKVVLAFYVLDFTGG
ncbi:MAG: redoxin domain-containing protein [Chloroflexi bacterium]|nr:redoxin domain-containing protein [Chloroflexota bacterium]